MILIVATLVPSVHVEYNTQHRLKQKSRRNNLFASMQQNFHIIYNFIIKYSKCYQKEQIIKQAHNA